MKKTWIFISLCTSHIIVSLFVITASYLRMCLLCSEFTTRPVALTLGEEEDHRVFNASLMLLNANIVLKIDTKCTDRQNSASSWLYEADVHIGAPMIVLLIGHSDEAVSGPVGSEPGIRRRYTTETVTCFLTRISR